MVNRPLLWIFIFGVLISFQNCGQFQPMIESASVRKLEVREPDIYGQVGTYNVNLSTVDDITEMDSYGWKLHIGSANYAKTSDPELWAKLLSSKVKIIDTASGYLWNTYCPRGTDGRPACDDSLVEKALLAFETYVKKTENYDNVVGFWVLDDALFTPNPELLKRAHDIIEQSNIRTGKNRAALCGFYLPLRTRSETPFPESDPNMRQFQYFTPDGCDYVTLYAYANVLPGVTSDQIDWSMSGPIQIARDILLRRGWDPAKQPMIGMPQAFSAVFHDNTGKVTGGYVNLTGDELR